MRRYTFYLSVALLAFGIGSFVVFKFYFQFVEQPLIVEKVESVENTSEIKTVSEDIKYGCKEKELESFWEHLDKQDFLKIKNQELKRLNYPIDYQESWDVSKNFDCSYFGGIEKQIDLNNDGEKELFVAGVWHMRNGERFIFKKVKNQFKVILFDLGSFEDEILENKTNDFSDIKELTNWTGTRRSIRFYKFNGKRYENKECFSEDHEIWKNGKITGFSNRPIITRERCAY